MSESFWWPSAIKRLIEVWWEDIVAEFGGEEPSELIECPDSLGYEITTAYCLIGFDQGDPVFSVRLSSANADAHLVLSDELTEEQRDHWTAHLVEKEAYSL